MKDKKLLKAAEEAKKDGYEFMSAVVKYEKKKPLYHVVSIESILKFGKWLPAKIEIMSPLKVVVKGQEIELPQHGVRVYAELPPKTISKVWAISKYCK